AVLTLVERLFEPAGMRNAEQRATEIIRPAMVGASKGLGIPLFHRTHSRTTMSTAVEEHGNISILLPHHNHRLAPDRTGEKIAGPRELTVMTNEHPTTIKDPL